jgi:AcrR family transcriptional regulator
VPAPNDHDARRVEVARAAVHSIARDGLDGATLRAVAYEGGWSVGVVQHYFRNKSELLAAAVEYLAERTSALLSALDPTADALHKLADLVQAIVPQVGVSDARYWRVWVCFWAQATTDPLLATVVEQQAHVWRELLTEVIRAGQADGSIRRGLSPEDEGAYLAAAINGLGVMAAEDPTARALPKAVERLLQPLSADRSSVPTPRKRVGRKVRLSPSLRW